MYIYELSHIGEFHVNHNEDFLIVEEAGDNRSLIAVMDGCSSGTDSYFASTLIGKLLRKLAKQESYREYAQNTTLDIEVLIRNISVQLFKELNDINRMLDLQKDEILSTLIIGVIDQKSRDGEIVVVGDGLIYCDGEYIEFENDNKPDYIGYHLGMDPSLCYETKTEKKSFHNIKDLSISTDGIFTFKNFDGEDYDGISEGQILKEFFEDKSNIENPNKLKKSLIKMKQDYGLMPSDDLSIIRALI